MLRRIMRRAMRHAELLGARETKMWKLVPVLTREMGQAFPELVRAQALITETIQAGDLADAIIDFDAGGVGHRPAEGRRLADGDGAGFGGEIANCGFGCGRVVLRQGRGSRRRRRRNFLLASGRESENKHG